MKKYKKICLYLCVIIGLLICVLPIMVSCNGSIEGIDSNTIVNLIFPNIWVFLATLLATIILFVTVIWLVWKPFNKKMDERKKYIQNELTEAETTKRNSLLEHEKVKNEYIKAQTEVNKMLIVANQKANALHDEIKNEANIKAHILLKNAKQDIENQKEKLQNTINEQILDVAFAAVTEIAKHHVSKQENDVMVEEFLKKLDKE